MSEKSEDKAWLSMSELARQAGVPESTGRRYVSTFNEFFAFQELPRGRKFSPECVLVLSRIQELYSEGYDTDSVRPALAHQFAITQNPDGKDEESALTTRHDAEFATKADIAQVMTAIEEMREETKQRETAREEWIRQRDEKLMIVLKEMQETKQLLATTQEKEKKGLWTRLFGK